MARPCHVYWGSHGCQLPHGHDGWHRCCGPEPWDPDVFDEFGFADTDGYVGEFPYYGPTTEFYGEDAEAAQHQFNAHFLN